MLTNLWQTNKSLVLALIAAGFVALSSIVIVPETQQVVVVRLGEPVRKINAFKPQQDFGQTGAGISWRIPFVEQLVWIDKRLLSFPMERQTVLSTDQLRLQGRRSWANVRCPQGLVRWDEVRQSRSVAEICNPSGTISRDTGTRNGDSDLLAIATCKFVPKTYFLPRIESFSWPRVDNARRYRVEWVDRDREVVI